MLYLDEQNIKKVMNSWSETINVIKEIILIIGNKDYVQPLKPYLRFRDLTNRIIAMPAFIGGNVNIAGIKWISSFPNNIKKDVPRAHSVLILNDADTGAPFAIINTALLSCIRTASVSGLVMKYFNNVRPFNKINLGIIGWGPIGKHHFDMCVDLFNDQIEKIFLFDINDIDKSKINYKNKEKIVITSDWQDTYQNADVLITCTVSKSPYIDRQPKKGSLHLNVSLRDYKTCMFNFMKNTIIVDDWEEVCREKTDIEQMHLKKGLQKQDTSSIIDVVLNNCIQDYPINEPIMFNPMGMAVYDIGIASYFVNKAEKNNIGTKL